MQTDFYKSIVYLRQKQKEHMLAAKNPIRRDALRIAIKQCAMVADDHAAALAEQFVDGVPDKHTLLLYSTYDRMREAFHQFMRTKSLPDREALRATEKAMDAVLKELKEA
jgi:hypothetical protein